MCSRALRSVCSVALLFFGASCAAGGGGVNEAASVSGNGADALSWTTAAVLIAHQSSPTTPAQLWIRISNGDVTCQTQESCADLVALDLYVSLTTGTDSSGNPITVPPSMAGTYSVAATNSDATVDYFSLDDSCTLASPGIDTATAGSVTLTAAGTDDGDTIEGSFDVMLPITGFHLTGAFTTPLCSLVVQ